MPEIIIQARTADTQPVVTLSGRTVPTELHNEHYASQLAEPLEHRRASAAET
ncbi:MAG: hypothetical protein ACLP8S_27560 [Solirubrobacteraceae bacterium]